MLKDIHLTREHCKVCDSIAPSQPSQPPVTPEAVQYPYQHICADYFDLHGNSFCVIVDHFSNWYDIHTGRGGAAWLADVFTNLFRDMGIPESLTTDGGTCFVSSEFQAFLTNYGVHHRNTSVAFPHANTRAEVAVKSAKRLLQENISPSGKLNGIALSKALMQYRNTPIGT